MYTIKEVANFSNISTRTLRYYDQIGLLKPCDYNKAGYRLYNDESVNKLQQILFYRQMGLNLKEIKSIVNDEGFDLKRALNHHHQNLNNELLRISTLIETVERTLKHLEGEIEMNANEKFEGLKKSFINENHQKYGEESKKRFGALYEDSIAKIENMNEKEFNSIDTLTKKVNESFVNAFLKGDVTSKESVEACKLHQQWIKMFWTTYSKEAHIGLAKTYVIDPQFKKYYDDLEEGLAVFVRDSLIAFLSE